MVNPVVRYNPVHSRNEIGEDGVSRCYMWWPTIRKLTRDDFIDSEWRVYSAQARNYVSASLELKLKQEHFEEIFGDTDAHRILISEETVTRYFVTDDFLKNGIKTTATMFNDVFYSEGADELANELVYNEAVESLRMDIEERGDDAIQEAIAGIQSTLEFWAKAHRNHYMHVIQKHAFEATEELSEVAGTKDLDKEIVRLRKKLADAINAKREKLLVNLSTEYSNAVDIPDEVRTTILANADRHAFKRRNLMHGRDSIV